MPVQQSSEQTIKREKGREGARRSPAPIAVSLVLYVAILPADFETPKIRAMLPITRASHFYAFQPFSRLTGRLCMFHLPQKCTQQSRTRPFHPTVLYVFRCLLLDRIRRFLKRLGRSYGIRVRYHRNTTLVVFCRRILLGVPDHTQPFHR